MFRHTFWIVPGVNAAAALSKLLKKHPVFKQFKVANVAGAGDEEEPYDEALKKVQEAIANNKYTITLSCRPPHYRRNCAGVVCRYAADRRRKCVGCRVYADYFPRAVCRKH